MQEGQNTDGTLTPPTSQESTEVKSEGLANPPQEKQPEMRMLTMDESDTLRSIRAFNFVFPDEIQRTQERMLDEICLKVSEVIISHFPAGKERSQALGNLTQVKLWCRLSLDMQAVAQQEAQQQ